MNILDAITTRASTRAFLDKPVTKELLHKILEAARWAPSGTNTQPWQVAVVSGEHKIKLCAKILAAYEAGESAHPDYHYYPTEWTEPYKSRRFKCGMDLYGALHIARDDKARRKAMWALNYRAFDAKTVIFFFIDKHLEKGSWLDYGMFMENVMLAAMEFGLATCPQAALAEYPDIVRNDLGPKFADKHLICGVAIGYPDTTADINNYRTEREAVDNFTQWFD